MKRILLLLLLAALLFSGCGSYKMEAGTAAVNPDGQLLCLVETREEAENLAALYGIALVDFGEGVAVFYTEEDPDAVIARGLENGWQELSLNTDGSYL